MDVINGTSAENTSLNTASEGSVDSSVGDPNTLGTETPKVTNTTIKIKGSPNQFPRWVYKNLPKFLAPLLDLYDINDQTRDVSLLSLLTHLSGACHFIKGNYKDRDYFPNLISFQIGPAASGKSEAKWATDIIESIDDVCIDPKNHLKGFIIAGDTSRAMLYAKLKANDGVGIITETEGDTISQNFRNDWGNFSAQLRASYQNETLRMERKVSQEVVKLKNPRFAMNVTMTAGQLSSLVNQRENGLFSRILFYIITTSETFSSPEPKSGGNTKIAACEMMSKELVKWYRLVRFTNLTFEMTHEQWEKFTQCWKERESKWKAQYGPDIMDIHKRIALSSFKIAMVLSAIRIEEIPASGVVTCSDQDLETALSLCETLFHHSMMAARILDPRVKKPNPQMRLIENLSENFTSKEFVDQAVAQGVSERDARRKLKKLAEDNIISKTAHGRYKKNPNGKI